MNNLVVLPMALPILVGAGLIFLKRQVLLQRSIVFVFLLINTIINVILLYQIQVDGIQTLHFGGWKPPYGISFVADTFAMLLVVTSTIITLICLIFAAGSIHKKRESFYFYPFVLFLLGGVNGSFLTGDLFNLFVTFEVMLLASYALITLGGTNAQLKASFKYIAINVVSSSFFLIAIAYLYGLTGTLNLADLSEKIADIGQTPLLTVVSLIFLLVFSIKSGLLLYQWLPSSYSTPPPAIAALFGALLTKVGVYALFRIFSLLFYHEPQTTHLIIGIMAGITIIGGCIGAIAYNNIRQIVTYNVIISIGFILIGLAVMTSTAYEGAIYYLIHDMLMKALLFLLAGAMIRVAKADRLDEISGLIRNYPYLGWFFFITTLSLAGIPPLSGFLGKVLIGEAAFAEGNYWLIGIGLFSSLIVLYSLLRVFMNCFWGETLIAEEEQQPMKKAYIVPGTILVLLTFILGIGAESIAPLIQDAAGTLADPSIYIQAVLYE